MTRTIEYVERTPALVFGYANELKSRILRDAEVKNVLMSDEKASELAYRGVAVIDFNNTYQMHRPLQGYAEDLVDAYRYGLI